MLYSTMYRYALFCFICFSSMHCVTGITSTFPNRHMKSSKCSVMTGTGLCKPWMLWKTKLTDNPRQQQHGAGHTLMQMERDGVLLGWDYSSGLYGGQGSRKKRVGMGLLGFSWAGTDKGFANHSPGLKR